MSHNCGHRRMRAEALPAMDVEDSEPAMGLTVGDLTNSPSCSVDPQQSLRVLAPEHPKEPHAQAYGSGDTEEHFIIPASEVGILRQEYSEFITLKDNTEIVLAEAMEATEWLNTVFS
ncbi:hypothetical protein M422DRAFT_271633 [Sphaerobolus stellatus SS14]|uniref:Uncharacterized protein n=1 Tax=Sphaerobolus stellatus (strain SS14) TaxID=990650 RepID=A0A0C9UDM6_SPHS4|nr:hypothetical protein M422DRAFT_271633 [Sphaerobolus stellatus SS14]